MGFKLSRLAQAASRRNRRDYPSVSAGGRPVDSHAWRTRAVGCRRSTKRIRAKKQGDAGIGIAARYDHAELSSLSHWSRPMPSRTAAR